MTEVAFHFNAPDKQAYACRLLRKALTAGSRVVVTAPADVLARLDALLWTFSQTDFLPHVRLPAEPAILSASPVVLTETPGQGVPHRQVLLNLGTTMPDGFQDYERVIEVVSLDDEDRQQARSRWKRYTELGYPIIRHDLNLKAAA